MPKAPVAKRAVQVPHWSWGEMRGVAAMAVAGRMWEVVVRGERLKW